MNLDQTQPCIGVDGGGTLCRFALCHSGHRFDVELTGVNATTDPQAIRAVVRRGLSDLAKAADLAPDTLLDIPAHLGLAGVVDDTMAEQLVRDLPLKRVSISDDRRTTMVGALGLADGSVVGIGTGSFLGRRVAGHDLLVGGWGFTLGDNASGADLGRAALRCTLEVHDGLRPTSELTHSLQTHFVTPADIVAFATTAKPHDFAHFAPQVVAAATSGDATASALMQHGARYIDETLRAIGWSRSERVCLLGGLATHYTPYVAQEVADAITPPEGTALDGALTLARAFVSGEHPPHPSNNGTNVTGST